MSGAASATQTGPAPALDPERYDRCALLTPAERRVLARLRPQRGRWPRDVAPAFARLVEPIEDVLAFVAPRAGWWARSPARGQLLLAIDHEQQAFWAWDRAQWVGVLERVDADVRQLVMAVAYLRCDQRDLHREFPGFKRGLFARRVLGHAVVDGELARVQAHLDGFGYAAAFRRPGMAAALFELMLEAGSPLLEDVARDAQAFVALHARERPALRHGVTQAAAALRRMGLMARSPFVAPPSDEDWLARSDARVRGVPGEWADWVGRWFCTSTLTRSTREHLYYTLLKAGRWFAEHEPAAAHPGAWTRQTATCSSQGVELPPPAPSSTMLIITHRDRAVAIAVRGRAYLLPTTALLEPEHPRRRWATCLAFFGRDVATGRQRGPYTPERADHFARCALLPDEEFLPLEQFPDGVLAEYFNVPLDQVAEKRVDLEAAERLRAIDRC